MPEAGGEEERETGETGKRAEERETLETFKRGRRGKRQKVKTAKRRNGGRCRSGSEIGGLETETGRRVASLGLGPLLPLRASVQRSGYAQARSENSVSTPSTVKARQLNRRPQREQRSEDWGRNGKKLKRQKEETGAADPKGAACYLLGQMPEAGGWLAAKRRKRGSSGRRGWSVRL